MRYAPSTTGTFALHVWIVLRPADEAQAATSGSSSLQQQQQQQPERVFMPGSPFTVSVHAKAAENAQEQKAKTTVHEVRDLEELGLLLTHSAIHMHSPTLASAWITLSSLLPRVRLPSACTLSPPFYRVCASYMCMYVPRHVQVIDVSGIMPGDYKIERAVFDEAQKLWGECTIDAFASVTDTPPPNPIQ